MQVEDIRDRIEVLEAAIEHICSHYDMDELRRNHCSYVRLRRINHGNVPTHEMEILKEYHNVYDRFYRKKKILSETSKHLDDFLERMSNDGFCNCKRKNTGGDTNGRSPYDLEFKLHPQNQLIQRNAFRFVEVDNSCDDPVVLCKECYEFLTNPEATYARSFQNSWPSFVWIILTDKDILDVYGVYVWRFLPVGWRYWWMNSLHESDVLHDVTIEYPTAMFKDISNEVRDMKSGLSSNTLSEIIRVCNKHLIPSVLCPWGESEYIHKCGNIPYDIMVQRYLPKCYIRKIHSDKMCEKVHSARDDYVRDSLSDYNDLLLNPSWKVLPSLAFVEGKGPEVMTCRNHNSGTNKKYIHPPNQPFHILPSEKGDQLCHAVVKSRFIKPMRASKYSNIYQMQHQTGNFQGIDTCDIVNFGDFSYCSALLDESESRSLMKRPDINSLLDNFEQDGYMTSSTVNGLRERALKNCPSDRILQKCLHGATYVELEDAMIIQREIGSDNTIKITLDGNNNETPTVITTKRNWLQTIIHCQKNDMDGYGATFHVVPVFKTGEYDTRILWLLSGMLVCVKELWSLTDKCDMFYSKWHGWLLAYLSKICFPGETFKNDHVNPIKKNHVSSIKKLTEKLGIQDEDGLDYEVLGGMFDDHEHVSVIYNSVLSDIFTHEYMININDEVIIMIYDGQTVEERIVGSIKAHGNTYELRFIALTVDHEDGNYKWDGKLFCRHGTQLHKSWWIKHRHKQLFMKTKNGTYDDIVINDVDICVYVIEKTRDMEDLRNSFMSYIGGQVKVQCSVQKLPLIVKTKSNEVCSPPGMATRAGRI